MLFSRPSDFDSTVLPFVAESTRMQAAEYQKAQGPRAFALTTSGLWLWRGGATIVQAIDKTMTDCAAQFKAGACLLMRSMIGWCLWRGRAGVRRSGTGECEIRLAAVRMNFALADNHPAAKDLILGFARR